MVEKDQFECAISSKFEELGNVLREKLFPIYENVTSYSSTVAFIKLLVSNSLNIWEKDGKPYLIYSQSPKNLPRGKKGWMIITNIQKFIN